MKKIKKIRAPGLLLLLMVSLLLFGCHNEKSGTEGLRFEYSTKPEVEADYLRAREAWGWFYVNELPAGDEPVEYQGKDYRYVLNDQIQTKADLEKYLGYLFSGDIVQTMLKTDMYEDVGGRLCVLPQSFEHEIKTSVVSGAAVKEGDGYRYTVTMNVIDPYEEDKLYGTRDVEFLYEKVNGHWLFTSFPEPSGPNQLRQADMRTVGDSMEDIKALLRKAVKAFQRHDYDTLLGIIQDDSVHDKTTLESYCKLVEKQFGDDAWFNISYIITDITSDGDQWNTCKVALSFNGKSVSAIGYRDFYFYITDRYGPWKLNDVCSFSFDPYYGGKKAPPYFQAKEASYRGITASATEPQILEKFGKPLEIIEGGDESSVTYVYSDAEYRFYKTEGQEGQEDHKGQEGQKGQTQLGDITVYGGDADTVRGIRLGDSFDSAVNAFPIEKDYNGEPDGVFFGQDTMKGQGGYLSDDLMIVTSENIIPCVKVEFLNGKVNRVSYMLYWLDGGI